MSFVVTWLSETMNYRDGHRSRKDVFDQIVENRVKLETVRYSGITGIQSTYCIQHVPASFCFVKRINPRGTDVCRSTLDFSV